MTRQTWTALVAAMAFVAVAAGLALIPVPFVTWSPGTAIDVLAAPNGKQVVSVTGTNTYPTGGQLDLTTVGVTTASARLTLPEALWAYWLPDRDTLPRDSVYAPGKSADQVESEDAQMMQSSQSEAVVAALRAAKQPVTELPQIAAVTINGPSQGKLMPGDFILAVDGTKVADATQISPLVMRHKIGEAVAFSVRRDGNESTVVVITGQSTNDPSKPAVGITVQTGYSYRPKVSFGIDPNIGGPSAGLIFALAIYDRLTPGQLVARQHVAGTGEIAVDGKVGPIGGAQEKISGAKKAGATVFLIPEGNCADVVGLHTSVRLVKVDTLSSAITALNDLNDPARAASVPGC